MKFTMKAFKNGELVAVEVNQKDVYRRPKPGSGIEYGRIVGIDTESKMYHNKLTTVTTQIAMEHKTELVVTADYQYAITAVFDTLFPEYATEDKIHDSKQRPKRERKDGKKCRDGSRKTITPVLGVFYNLEYDGPRLFGNHPQFMRATTAEFDNVCIQVGEYNVEIVSCLLKGGAPSFEFKVRKDKKVMRLLGQDMWGYWKEGLNKTAQQLLGKQKEEYAKEDHKQTWEQFLELDKSEQDEFYKYAYVDAELTREIYIATEKLLLEIQPNDSQVLVNRLSEVTHTEKVDMGLRNSIVIRRNGCIPVSAPSAAARMAFAMGLPEWKLPGEWVYKMGALTYAGARVFNRRRAYVEDMTVMDISSAYPHAMSIIPDPARCKYRLVPEGEFDIEYWKGKWGCLCVSGENLDAYYPALRVHNTTSKTLQYVHGDFEKVWASVPEIVIGVVSGRLKISAIHTGCEIIGSCEKSFLREFILKVYKIKSESAKGSPMYLAAKLLMNALYGKLVEIQTSNRWLEDKMRFDTVLAIPGLDKPENVTRVQEAYDDGSEGIEKLFDEWKEKYPLITKTKIISEVLKEKPAKAGQFYMPMIGAQITGFVSAKLGLAASCTTSLQGDTDSVFFEGKHKDGMQAYKELMLYAGYDCPDEGLGSFELEVEGASGYLVKTKMYALKYEKKGEVFYKAASHGMRGVRDRKLIYEYMKIIMETGTVDYKVQQVRKWHTAYKKSIKTGEDVAPGEFFEQEVKISAPVSRMLERDEHSEWRWKRYEEIL